VNFRNKLLPTLTLFSSLSTLFCCALPALLVSVGAGAVMASLVTAVPQLVSLSEHKVALFAFAGLMLGFSVLNSYRNRNAPCPIDPVQKRSCLRLRRWSVTVLCVSLSIYAIGFFFAFIAGGR
jgi:hypothetical protein